MDISTLMAPLEGDSPCGNDLEYELEYGELVRAAKGTPAQELDDKNKKEAVPPDWKAVRDLALGLLEQTRDLRIGVHLTNALVALDGYAGLRDGLALIAGWSDAFWDEVHPLLDEDDGDPVFRCNAVRELNNIDITLQLVLDAPLVESRRAGRYGMRALKVIEGKLSHKGEEAAPTPELLNAAFQDVETDAVVSIAETLQECVALVQGIQTNYTAKVGAGEAPDLSGAKDKLGLQGLLEDAAVFVEQRKQSLGLGDAEGGDAAAAAHGQPANQGAPVAMGAVGAVSSRDDVVRSLEAICNYYRVHEPSSPVPILLNRAASLVHKSFIEIIGDLAPGGLREAEGFVGNASPSAASPAPATAVPDNDTSDGGGSSGSTW